MISRVLNACDHSGTSQGKKIASTREKNRKYATSYLRFQNSCATILAMRYLRFCVCTCDFFHTCEKKFKHTCDLNHNYVSKNRKYGGQKRPTTHVSQVFHGRKSQVCKVQIASMQDTNRKYSMYKSQVFQVRIASMSSTNRKYAYLILSQVYPT